MTEEKLPKKPLISYCGICCSLCPSYRSKYCPGCPELEDCKIVQCAKSKNIRYCFKCNKFPCKLFEEGFDWDLDKFENLKKFKLGTVKWKPYAEEYIKLFKIGKQLKKNKSFSLYLNELKNFNLPKGKYAIFGSGPLGVRNIRDTHDLDIIVYEEIFNKYKGKAGWKFKDFERDGRHVEMIENNGIEFYKTWGPGEWDIHKLIEEAEIINGLPFVKLDEVAKWKNLSEREKDLKDVQLINEYLQNSGKQK